MAVCITTYRLVAHLRQNGTGGSGMACGCRARYRGGRLGLTFSAQYRRVSGCHRRLGPREPILMTMGLGGGHRPTSCAWYLSVHCLPHYYAFIHEHQPEQRPRSALKLVLQDATPESDEHPKQKSKHRDRLLTLLPEITPLRKSRYQLQALPVIGSQN